MPRVGRDVTPVSTMLRTVAGLCLTTGRLRDKYHAHSLDLKVFFPPRVSWQTFRVIGEDIGIETAVELGEKIFLRQSSVTMRSAEMRCDASRDWKINIIGLYNPIFYFFSNAQWTTVISRSVENPSNLKTPQHRYRIY